MGASKQGLVAQGVIYVDSCLLQYTVGTKPSDAEGVSTMLQYTVGTKPSGAEGVQYPCGDQS